MLDKDTRGGITAGEGEALSIRGFQDEMRLKLRGVFPGNSDHPPELVNNPRGIVAQQCFDDPHMQEALVGFQGRGCADGVQPDFCYPLSLEALLFQWSS